VQPEIHIFGLTLQSFGLMMGLGFVVAGICATRHIQELGKPQDWGYEMIFAALVGGLIGARLWWIGENWSDAKDDLLGSLFSGTGLVWYGGAFGGAIAVLAWAAWRRWLTLSMLDVAAVGLAAGYAIGRIGCQLSGDGDYGIPWDGPWAMAYPHGTGADDRDRAPDPGLRDVRDAARRLVAVAPPPRVAARGRCSPPTSCWPGSSASWWSSSAATPTSSWG
jgi:phosphatidylglycerol:prolipoprotein diacylglycerol transferase